MRKKAHKKGFTLIEMLVVLGVIAALSSALLIGFGGIAKRAQLARAQETVSNVATSLNILLQNKNSWPGAIISNGGSDAEGKGCIEAVARVFAKNGLMGISIVGQNLKGVDRFGIVDPWAIAVLKRNPDATVNTKVPSGGTIKSHIIYYAVDKNLDGITEATICGESIKVRASAIAWCAGADGEMGDSYSKRGKANSDNVYSWRRSQEVKK